MAKKSRPNDRFHKQSPKLIYETHQAPVGCGGVVMRWRDPLAGLPVSVHLYCSVKAKLFLDGIPLEATGIDIAPGPHLFAIETPTLDLSGGLFMFAAYHDRQDATKEMPPGVRESGWELRSTTDQGWRATTDQPSNDGWLSLDYDDGRWVPLSRSVAAPEWNWRMPNAFAAHRCLSRDAAFLALPEGKGRSPVWIRVRANVPLPQIT